MTYDISILIPSIRTHYWPRIYNALLNSCKKYKWQLILVGPFIDKEFINTHNNVKYISSYANVSVCVQIGTLACDADLIYHTTDDAISLPNSLDICLDFHKNKCTYKDVINSRYREGINYATSMVPSGGFIEENYWTVKQHPSSFNMPGINQEWKISLQPIVSKTCFVELGGFDCGFEYINHSLHDFMFRLQKYGGTIYNSPTEVSYIDWAPGIIQDHQPVNDAQLGPDTDKFISLWSYPSDRLNINYNNCQQYDNVWKRRFDKLYTSYKQLYEEKKYHE